MAPLSVARGVPQSGDRAAAGVSRPRKESDGAFASRYGVASSFGRHCSALRGRTIRVVAFRASHPAKPPSRQRRFVLRFLINSAANSTADARLGWLLWNNNRC